MRTLSSIDGTGRIDLDRPTPSHQVACVAHAGQDVIIVPVDSSFGLRPAAEQARTIEAFQRCAAASGMAGTAVAVWDDGTGRMAFRAPPPLHEFLRNIDIVYVATALNRELICD